MKYTKTVPYFKKGDKVKKRVEVGNTGKTKEEIMAEARSNQTREKGQQAMDKEAKLAAENRKTAADNANISKPKTDLSTKTIAKQPLAKTFGRSLTEIKRAPVKQSLDELSFGEAFNKSYNEGLKVFEWKGKKYSTDQKKEETPVPEQKTNREQHSKDVKRLPRLSRWKSLGWNWFNLDPGTGSVDTKWTHTRGDGVNQPWLINRFVTSGDKDVAFLSIGDNKRILERNIQNGDTTYVNHRGDEDRWNIYKEIFADGDKKVWESRGYQQGGTINKFQRGTQGSGITRADLPTTSKWNIFGFQPDAAKWFPTDRDLRPGQTEEVSRYMHRNKDITTLRRPRPYYTADQPSMYNSTRTINWDNNTPVDTTYTYRGKVIQPNTIDYERYKAAFAGGDRALLQNIGKHQQGGQVEQQPQMTEEDLVIDFTVRYFSALGVAPEDIMDQQGSLNPAYVEEITNVFQQGDIDWESYMASPDEYIQQFVGSRMQMARKGAKLKRLSQLRIYKK